MGILFLIYAFFIYAHPFQETKLWRKTRPMLYLDLSRREVTGGRRKLYNEALVTCTVLCCAVLYCTVLYCTVLYCTVLYYTVLYCVILYCTVLCYTVLYCTILYCAVL